MNFQAQRYLEDMKAMYLDITKKEKITFMELLFLQIYKKTIDNSINIDNFEKI